MTVTGMTAQSAQASGQTTGRSGKPTESRDADFAALMAWEFDPNRAVGLFVAQGQTPFAVQTGHVEARGQRVATMKSEAREGERAAGARGAGISNAAGTQGLSGRAQRLQVQADAAITQDAPVGQRAGNEGPFPALSTPRHPSADGSETIPVSSPPRQACAVAPPAPPRESDRLPLLGRDPARSGQAGLVDRAEGIAPFKPFDSNGPVFSVHAGATSPASASTAALEPEPDASTPAKMIAQMMGARAGSSDASKMDGMVGVGRPSQTPGRPAEQAKTADGSQRPEQPAGARVQAEDGRSDFEKLVRNIRLNMGHRLSTARIRLSPPELGQVRVDVKLRDSRLELRVHAETPEARDILAERMESLRSALERHGLVTDRMELTHDREGSREATMANAGGLPDARSQEQRGGEGRWSTEHGPNEGPYMQGESVGSEIATAVIGSVQEARLDIQV